jgi:hypothetical protein
MYSADELDIIVDQWLNVIEPLSLERPGAYVATNCVLVTGRASLLGREKVWAVVSDGRQLLARKRRHTLPGMLRDLAQKLKDFTPPYTNIVVDESQLFTTIELTLIRHLAPAGPDDLFFSEDRRQSIRKGSFTWRDVGVEVKADLLGSTSIIGRQNRS